MRSFWPTCAISGEFWRRGRCISQGLCVPIGHGVAFSGQRRRVSAAPALQPLALPTQGLQQPRRSPASEAGWPGRGRSSAQRIAGRPDRAPTLHVQCSGLPCGGTFPHCGGFCPECGGAMSPRSPSDLCLLEPVMAPRPLLQPGLGCVQRSHCSVWHDFGLVDASG